MIEYNDELYIGGVYGQVGELNANNFAKLNGTEWGTCDEGIGGISEEAYVSSIQVFDNFLYVFGKFDVANTTSCNNIIKFHY